MLENGPGGNVGKVLLLVWPFNESQHSKREGAQSTREGSADLTPWDAQAVSTFWRGGGSVVVHVGELPLSPLAVSMMSTRMCIAKRSWKRNLAVNVGWPCHPNR